MGNLERFAHRRPSPALARGEPADRAGRFAGRGRPPLQARRSRGRREAFGKYYLRPRRLVDVSRPDTSFEIFGGAPNVKAPDPKLVGRF